MNVALSKDVERKDLKELTVSELRFLCRNEGIKGYSGHKRDELLELIKRSREKEECPMCGDVVQRYGLSTYLREHKHPFVFQRDIFVTPKKPRQRNIKCNECGHYFAPSEHFHLDETQIPNTLQGLKSISKRMGIKG